MELSEIGALLKIEKEEQDQADLVEKARAGAEQAGARPRSLSLDERARQMAEGIS